MMGKLFGNGLQSSSRNGAVTVAMALDLLRCG